MARNITRSNPMSDIARFGGFPNIEDILRELSMVPSLRGNEAEPRMRVDVEETDQAYILKAEVPGARKEDIRITIDGNMVSIRADVMEEKTEQSGTTIRNERYFGEQYRTFTLPQEVDESKAEAKYENGVLVLTLPKKSGRGGKQLTVQ
jgi:HSP20 family protein